MRARRTYLVALAVAVAGLAAYAVVPPLVGRQHRAAAARADRIVARLPDLAGAQRVTDRTCAKPTIRRCFETGRDAPAVADELAAALRQAAGRIPERRCDESETRRGTRLRFCSVRVPTGRGHGVVLTADDVLGRRKDGTEYVSATKVWYTAF